MQFINLQTILYNFYEFPAILFSFYYFYTCFINVMPFLCYFNKNYVILETIMQFLRKFCRYFIFLWFHYNFNMISNIFVQHLIFIFWYFMHHFVAYIFLIIFYALFKFIYLRLLNLLLFIYSKSSDLITIFFNFLQLTVNK